MNKHRDVWLDWLTCSGNSGIPPAERTLAHGAQEEEHMSAYNSNRDMELIHNKSVTEAARTQLLTFKEDDVMV